MSSIAELENFIDQFVDTFCVVNEKDTISCQYFQTLKYKEDQSTNMSLTEEIEIDKQLKQPLLLDNSSKPSLNTGTPRIEKHGSIVDMLMLKDSSTPEMDISTRQKKRKYGSSPIIDGSDLESDNYDSDDFNTTVTEKYGWKETKYSSDSVIKDMQKSFESTLERVISGMTASFATQFKTFTNEIKDILKQSNTEQGDEIKNLKDLIDSKDQVIDNMAKEIETLARRTQLCEGRLTRNEKEIYDVKEDLVHVEASRLKNNLIFYNIAENEELSENVRITLHQFFENEMKIPEHDISKISVDSAYRMGAKKDNGNRPIMAKICSAVGKSIIFQFAKNLDKTKKFGISEQLPHELNMRKSLMMPKFKEAKEQNKKPKWSADKLIINNQIYKAEKDKIRDLNYNTEAAALSVKLDHAPPKTYLNSTFQGHSTDIQNQNDVVSTIHALMMDCRVARATHNIYAYRIDDGFQIVEHYEDDGEWGGGRELLRVLQENNIVNKFICVTRWYGGKNLGPSRFDYIKEAGRMALHIY